MRSAKAGAALTPIASAINGSIRFLITGPSLQVGAGRQAAGIGLPYLHNLAATRQVIDQHTPQAWEENI